MYRKVKERERIGGRRPVRRNAAIRTCPIGAVRCKGLESVTGFGRNRSLVRTGFISPQMKMQPDRNMLYMPLAFYTIGAVHRK